jgi:hypothetical protein
VAVPPLFYRVTVRAASGSAKALSASTTYIYRTPATITLERFRRMLVAASRVSAQCFVVVFAVSLRTHALSAISTHLTSCGIATVAAVLRRRKCPRARRHRAMTLLLVMMAAMSCVSVWHQVRVYVCVEAVIVLWQCVHLTMIGSSALRCSKRPAS